MNFRNDNSIFDASQDFNIVDQTIELDGYIEYTICKKFTNFEYNKYPTTTYFDNETINIELNSTNLRIGDYIAKGTIIGKFGLNDILAPYNLVIIDKKIGYIVVKNLENVFADFYLEATHYFEYSVGDKISVNYNNDTIGEGEVINVDFINIVDGKIKVTVSIDNSETKFFGDTAIVICKKGEQQILMYYINSSLNRAYDNIAIEAYVLDDSIIISVVVLSHYSNNVTQVNKILVDGKEIEIQEGMIFYAKSDYLNK